MTDAEVPDGWSLRPLSAIAGKPQYGWTTRARPDGEIKLLRTTDITSGTVDWSKIPACETEPPDVAKYELHPGDIVVSRAGSVGFSYLVDQSCPPKTIFASYLMRVRPDVAIIDPKFLRYYMRSPRYWTAIHDAAVGIGMANVNGSKLGAMLVPVPPRPIQDELTTLLGAVENMQLSTATVMGPV